MRAAEAGMWGIALDTRRTGAIHAFSWAAYSEGAASRDELRANARDLGIALGGALTGDARITRVLVLTEELESTGPLWFSLLEGLLLSVENSPATVSLVVCPSGPEPDLPTLRKNTEKWLEVKLSGESMRVWQRAGTVDFGVSLTAAGVSDPEIATTVPDGSLETFKKRLIECKLNASLCVLNTAEVPGPWLNPEAGAAGVDFQTPLDASTRVGRIPIAGAEADVLRQAGGAALVFASGIPGGINIPGQASPVVVTELISGAETKYPAEQTPVELEPTTAPAMVSGLPVRTWAAPAGLWFSASPLQAGQTRAASVRYGWVNRTGMSMTGALETSVPGRFAITPSGLSFSSADGESVSATGRISGALGGAPSFSVRLVVAAPRGEPIVRDVPVSFSPPLHWAAEMDGPIEAAPTAADLDGDGQPEIYAASAAGDVASFSLNGALRWRWESSASISTPPVVFRHWSGTPLVAVLDDAGWLHCYRSDGVLRFEVDLAAQVRDGHFHAANLHGFPGQELVCTLENGQIRALLSNGQEFWKVDTQSGIVGLAVVPGSEKRDTAVVTLDDSSCIAIAADGARLWKTALPGPAVSSPVVELAGGSRQPDVVVGIKDGAILRISIADGSIGEARPLPNRIVPRRIVPLGQTPSGHGRLLIADGTSLTCLGTDMRVQWTVDVPNDGYPVPVEGKRGTIVLLPTRQGAIWALDDAGTVLWKETRSAGSISNVLTPLPSVGRQAWIYASQDGFLRAIDIP